ncbi:MAG: cellulose synthase catalytic subunit [Synechococcaceae cyanobacterium]|nr:cellulose synthase catalytic subunit [Synechococcaceae cyanobacterium]
MRLPWAVALLAFLAGRYLIWRIGSTLNLSTPLAATLSLTALAAELLLLAGTALTLAFSLWLPRPGARPSDPPPPPPGAWPAVDVLVPTYGEPLDVVERCLRGCLDLEGPPCTIWLLDDGGRAELRALCTRLGIRYLHRAERHHAKAGNLNHALPFCRGELLAVFDADVVPLATFLVRTVPLFADPALGFVQTPQSAMTADPVMRNLGLERWLLPDEEGFYRWIEPCRDAVGAVVCAGTSFVMRRSALEQVGGFETGTSSEDLATGIRLAAAGYRNRYLAEKLSAGLAPFTAAAMARQRCRWASGTLQLLRTGASPLTIAGLSPLQRLAYLEGVLHWFNVLPQLVLALLPLSLGVLGVAPLRLSGEGLLVYALPFYGAQMLLIRWLSAQSRTALLPELYRWILLVPLAGAVLRTLLGRPLAFHVTPKALPQGRRTTPDRRLLLPLLLLLSLQVVGLLNLLRPALAVALAPLSSATLAVSVAWSVFTVLMLALALRACVDRPGLSPVPWFALRLPARLRGAWGERAVELQAISERGVELRLREPLEPPPAGPAAGPLVLLVDGLPPLALEPVRWASRRLGGHWLGGQEGRAEALRRFLYGRPGLWPLTAAPPELLALPRLLARLLWACPPEAWFRRSLIRQSPPAAGRADPVLR